MVCMVVIVWAILLQHYNSGAARTRVSPGTPVLLFARPRYRALLYVATVNRERAPVDFAVQEATIP